MSLAALSSAVKQWRDLSPLQLRVLSGLAYGVLMLGTAWVWEPLFWAVLALAFALSYGECRLLLPAPRWQPILLAGLALSFLSLGVLRGYFGFFPALAGFLLSAFAFDTASYFGGRALGGPKLVPKTSPNKTQSGALCGLAAVIGLSPWLIQTGHGGVTFIYALLLSLVFLAGDLLISHLKRLAGVKDTGALIPGHGGVLDRMDSLLLAAPLYWGLLWLIG